MRSQQPPPRSRGQHQVIIGRVGATQAPLTVGKLPSVRPPAAYPRYTDKLAMRIAIVQTGCWGDNINSTLMFGPLRRKYPGCVLDVYTSTKYGAAFHNNPLITNLLEEQADTKEQALHLHHVIPPRLVGAGYDIIYVPHPMINPDKWTSLNHDFGNNLINAWIRALEHSKVEYELPLETILRLTADEVREVDIFCGGIDMQRRNVLMEIHTESGQSFWDYQWTLATARHLLDKRTNLFISRGHDGSDIDSIRDLDRPRVHFAGGLSLRQCAELYNRCHIFFSVSSGLSNACNSNWCRKDKKWIETINSPDVNSSPIRTKGKTFWYKNDIPAFLTMLREHGI